MGTYFDFLSNMGGDPPVVPVAPKKRPLDNAFPEGEGGEGDYRTVTPAPLDSRFAAPNDPRWALAEHRLEERDLVQREGAALKRARELLGVGRMTGGAGGDAERIRQALTSKSYTLEQLASDLDVIIKKRGAPGHGQQDVSAFAALRNELGNLIEARAKFDAKKAPPMRQTVDPAEVAAEAKAANEKAQALEREAAGMGILTRENNVREAKILREQAKALEGQLQKTAGEAPPPPPDPPLRDVLAAHGVSKKDFMKRGLAIAQALSFNMNASLMPGAGPMAAVNMMSALGEGGQRMMEDWAKAFREKLMQPQQGKGLMGGRQELEQDPYAATIQSRHAQLDAARDEMRRTDAFSSMWHVLAYVLFAMMMGPKPAMLLWSNKSKKGELKEEVDDLVQELKGLYDNQARAAALRETARHHAAMENLREREFQHQRYKDEEYLELRRAVPRGQSKEYDAVLDGYRILKDRRDDLMDKIDNSFSFDEDEVEAAKSQLPQVEGQLEGARNMLLQLAGDRARVASGGGRQ